MERDPRSEPSQSLPARAVEAGHRIAVSYDPVDGTGWFPDDAASAMAVATVLMSVPSGPTTVDLTVQIAESVLVIRALPDETVDLVRDNA